MNALRESSVGSSFDGCGTQRSTRTSHILCSTKISRQANIDVVQAPLESTFRGYLFALYSYGHYFINCFEWKSYTVIMLGISHSRRQLCEKYYNQFQPLLDISPMGTYDVLRSIPMALLLLLAEKSFEQRGISYVDWNRSFHDIACTVDNPLWHPFHAYVTLVLPRLT